MAENESNLNPQGSQGTTPAGTDGNAAPPAASQTPAIDADYVRKIEASFDKSRTKFERDRLQMQAEIEELRKTTMSESELRKLKEQRLQERESTLARKELELLAVDVLREHDIPLNLREFIVGKDADDTKARAGTLKIEFQKAVEAAVQERFKQNGREPHKSENTPPAGKGKIYTRAEAEAEAKRVQLPNVPQKERETVMADLTAAMREGRIKN
jgi:hypothetical protein